MADAPPRFFVDPGGRRRERVAPKRPAPRDLRPVVHSAYEDENKQGLGCNEHDPRHGLRLGRVLVGGVVNTSRSERGDGEHISPVASQEFGLAGELRTAEEQHREHHQRVSEHAHGDPSEPPANSTERRPR